MSSNITLEELNKYNDFIHKNQRNSGVVFNSGENVSFMKKNKEKFKELTMNLLNSIDKK